MIIEKFKSAEIEKACQILRRGGVVIFPTDTVYGVGCMANNNGAVSRLYSIKKKPQSEPSALLISRWDELFTLSCQLNEKIESLLKKYWSGALTVLLASDSKSIFPPLLKEGKLGVRMPDNAVTKELIRGVGYPLIGTSANFHGEEPPTKFEEIDMDFIHSVDFCLQGDCQLGRESTIVDCTVEPFKIIRQGALEIEADYL
jgi:L-threonylcarbamoyladenylate synthase